MKARWGLVNIIIIMTMALKIANLVEWEIGNADAADKVQWK